MNVTSPARRSLTRLASFVVGFAVLVLALFHGALLWRRFLDASIVQPGVLWRWLASALLVAGLVSARRRVRHTFLVFWLLVALLHVGTPVEQQVFDRTTRLGVVVQIGLSAVYPAVFLLVIAAAAIFTPAAASFDGTALPSTSIVAL